jgi:hypothetical protein
MDEKTLGQVAFEAYVEEREGKNHDGSKTPPWEELGDGVRAGWEAAAGATMRYHAPGDRESRCKEAVSDPDEGGDAGKPMRVKSMGKQVLHSEQLPELPEQAIVEITSHAQIEEMFGHCKDKDGVLPRFRTDEDDHNQAVIWSAMREILHTALDAGYRVHFRTSETHFDIRQGESPIAPGARAFLDVALANGPIVPRQEPRPIFTSFVVTEPTLLVSLEHAVELLGEGEAEYLANAFYGTVGLRGIWAIPHPEAKQPVSEDLIDQARQFAEMDESACATAVEAQGVRLVRALLGY